jgi:hypothetical protein
VESKIAQEWLDALARTANAKDYVAHMDLISKDVKVYGVPGFEVIDYNDWAAQSKHEFETGLLHRVSYEGMKVRTMTPANVMFKVKETIEGTDGTVTSQGVEIIIRKEFDGKWRVLQERILSVDEMEHDGGRLQ